MNPLGKRYMTRVFFRGKLYQIACRVVRVSGDEVTLVGDGPLRAYVCGYARLSELTEAIELTAG